MKNTPLKNYGFNYTYNEKEFAFDVMANSEAEAVARVAAMSAAECFGQLKESLVSQSPECPVWTLPAGSLLHIGGMPYFTTEPTRVEGYGDPVERLKPMPLTGTEEAQHPA